MAVFGDNLFLATAAEILVLLPVKALLLHENFELALLILDRVSFTDESAFNATEVAGNLVEECCLAFAKTSTDRNTDAFFSSQ